MPPSTSLPSPGLLSDTAPHSPELLSDETLPWPGPVSDTALREEQVRKGLLCPDCSLPTILESSKGRNRRRCPGCGAIVYCLPSSDRAMGRVAGSSLRGARIAAHIWFDAIWKNKLKKSRYNAYSWLSLRMKLNKDVAHIAMFSPRDCLRAIDICRDYIRRHRPDLEPSLIAATARYEGAVTELKKAMGEIPGA